MAVNTYDDIVDTIGRTTETTDRSMVDWCEEALYRGSLLLLGHRHLDNVKTSSIQALLRAYQKITSSQPSHWRVYKRTVITKYSLDYLSSSYRRNQYSPPPLTDDSVEMDQESFKMYEREMFLVELTHLYAMYEKLVYSLVSFPKSGMVNQMVLDMVDRFAEDMELTGNSSSDLHNFIEILNRATQRTFNSSRITRHLFNTLVRLGDFKEAEHALSSYLYLVGLQSQVTKETHGWGDAITIDKHGRASTIPFMNVSILRPLVEDALSESTTFTYQQNEQNANPNNIISSRRPSTIASKRTDDKESVESILDVLMTGTRMYCKYLNKGTEAVEMAELAKMVLDVAGGEKLLGQKTSGRVYRYIGVAYGVLAADTTDPDIRPNYHGLAKKYLQQSVTLDNESWESYYQLAKQCADMRDINDALQAVVKSLEINPKYLPSWHLLVLLYSCPKQDDLAKALKMCELGLNEAKALQLEWSDDSEEYEHQLLLNLTHMLLVESIHGTNAALECQEELFSMYGRLVLMDPEATSSGDSDGNSGGGRANNTTDSYASRRDLVVSGSLGNICETYTMNNSNNNNSTDQPPGMSSTGTTTNSTPSPSTTSTSGASMDLSQQMGSSLPQLNDSSHQYTFHPDSPSRQQPSKGSGYLSSLQGDHDDNKYKRHSFRNMLRKKKKNPLGYHLSYSANDVSKDSSTHGFENGSLTSFHSISQSIASNKSLFQPQRVHQRRPAWTHLRRKQIRDILCLLWMTSASTFLRQGRLEEALKAVEEAEKVNWTTEPKVWCLLGQVRLGQSKREEAIEAFQKGLVADPTDTDNRLWLAKTYMEMGDLVISQGALNALTQGKGWNSAESWFCLGDIYSKTDRINRAKDCLFYALELEDSQPIQSFTILPRCI
ncbi:hypothetical protein BC941DRAFT_203015 [Chlamydoabsidia padenii]|nr:hypothetical protein BC941DRAFT_203015 [Chlamydoabsidia padenii]